MIAAVHTAVIVWQPASPEAIRFVEAERDAAASGPGVGRTDLTLASTIDPFWWDSGRPQQCYDNVTQLIDLLGGEMVHGWALADSGPLSTRGESLPLLYSRWINHVVWRDRGGKLWEVTPRFEVGAIDHIAWEPTRFAPDPAALFVQHAAGHWAQPSQYVALRPEGERVASLLRSAEITDDDERRLRLVQLALAELAAHGFTPQECRLETTGGRINNVWLIAE